MGIRTTYKKLSVSQAIETKELVLKVTGNSDTSNVLLTDGAFGTPVPSSLNGWNLVNVVAVVATKGITGTTNVQIRRVRGGVAADMLSTPITVGDEWFAEDGIIDTNNDDVQTGDMLYPDVKLLHSGTVPKGLRVVCEFRAS